MDMLHGHCMSGIITFGRNRDLFQCTHNIASWKTCKIICHIPVTLRSSYHKAMIQLQYRTMEGLILTSKYILTTIYCLCQCSFPPLIGGAAGSNQAQMAGSWLYPPSLFKVWFKSCSPLCYLQLLRGKRSLMKIIDSNCCRNTFAGKYYCLHSAYPR